MMRSLSSHAVSWGWYGFALGLVALGAPLALAEPAPESTIKVLTFNVGTAHVSGFKPDCPNFKLCHKDAIQRISELVEQTEPDILLLNETQGETQLFGTHGNGPVLPSRKYDARCTAGHSKIVEVCVAWRTDRFQLVGQPEIACRTLAHLTTQGGGAILCSLQSLDGKIPRLDLVSVHGSAAEDPSRQELYREIWNSLTQPGVPTIVGGDFNTEKCTSGEADCRFPAPLEYGTLYGGHVENFGRWVPDDSFFGTYVWNIKRGRAQSEGSKSTHYRKKLDHVFANFGEAPVAQFTEAEARKQPCTLETPSWATRVPFDGGFTWFFGGIGWKTDHYPILSCHRL